MRFNAMFYFSVVENEMQVTVDGREIVDSTWISPENAIAGHLREGIFISDLYVLFIFPNLFLPWIPLNFLNCLSTRFYSLRKLFIVYYAKYLVYSIYSQH